MRVPLTIINYSNAVLISGCVFYMMWSLKFPLPKFILQRRMCFKYWVALNNLLGKVQIMSLQNCSIIRYLHCCIKFVIQLYSHTGISRVDFLHFNFIYGEINNNSVSLDFTVLRTLHVGSEWEVRCKLLNKFHSFPRDRSFVIPL